MVDFLMITPRLTKNGVTEIFPRFIIKKTSDLMIRGRDFYAIWQDDKKLWSTDEQDALQIIDRELDEYAKKYSEEHPHENLRIMYMWDSENNMIEHWHRYCQKHMRDSYHMLDERLIFSNEVPKKRDYASKQLSYPLVEGDHESYDLIMSTLYSPEERHKIEWAVGSIITGDSKKIQKFMVLYGSAGTGKSTVLNIIQQLFEGYYSVFDAKALGSSNNSFALESFRSNPLVAIQHDGDLSKIEDNTRLNSLVSHEQMTVNEKFKATYTNRFKCFLFMGTNKPVKITDSRSGLIRRLIDVSPSGNKLNVKDYKAATKKIEFELGAIACHCRDVYLENPSAYDSYIPTSMLGASNDFYNYVLDSFFVFKKEDGTTLKSAWEMYKTYNDDAKVQFGYSQRVFKEELKNYFKECYDRYVLPDGTRVRTYFKGFKTDKFEPEKQEEEKESSKKSWLIFSKRKSKFDLYCSECAAQYAKDDGTPKTYWSDVVTTITDLDTTKLHYVKVPENHIVIDFDIPGPDGKKDYNRNLEEASKWPPTYAELSKSGSGIHLHYIYDGDPSKLSRIYDDHIEIKVFTGNSSLRRLLTKCSSNDISHINSGLPLKGEEKMVNFDAVKSEKAIRVLILKNLNKEYHAGTKPSIDFIYKILDDAYNNGVHYDVTDMRQAITCFASKSTHQAQYCLKMVAKMKFKSEESSEPADFEHDQIVFYDIEVFPNLFLVNWKIRGEGHKINRLINPSPHEIEELIKFKLVGFNCRRYDNHILYGRLIGYDNARLYHLSQGIVSGSKNCFFGEAYNISYTDIYDFASAGNKKSLKKLEIEMGIHHQELGLPWDKPVPEELWEKVAEYCDNDVIATEAAFDYLSADWTAREILADLAGMTVNDTTNSLTTCIIFGLNKTPQDQFNYRDLSKPVPASMYEEYKRKFGDDYDFRIFDSNGNPTYKSYSPMTDIPDDYSILPFFPGYTYNRGKSIYKGEEVGEGGYVYAEPGIHCHLALLDVASMHPHSALAEVLFGPAFTKKFKDIVYGRVNIKHEDWNEVNNMLDGKLTPYVQKVINGEMTSKQLANALKTAINSVYGLTSASFENPFRDSRNVDNIVAKRGALFMINLKYAVMEKGFTVAHIKTDSIKIPDATPEIIQFVMDYGKEYGYTFEHEATYDRMCLVNDAVYIAKYETGEWTATGTQFQVPYVFKTLFSKEPIEFDDLCETKSVTSSMYLDMNESFADVTKLEQELFVITKGDREPERQEELKKIIDANHNRVFIGKVGQFCPIQSGKGGGLLVRESIDKNGNPKYDSVTGAKDYRWLESEYVRTKNLQNFIDKSYYTNLVNKAIDAISQYGDFEAFLA